MKKVLSILLTVAIFATMLCGMTVYAAEEAVTVTVDEGYEDLWADAAYDGTYLINNTGDYKFLVTIDEENGTLTLGRAGIEFEAPTVCFPSSFTLADGTTYTVTTIGKRAITKNYSGKNNETKSTDKSIKKIVVSNGIKVIEAAAFRDASVLTDVVLPSTITSIGEYCFDKCKALESVTLPSSVTSLGTKVFSNCTKLSTVIFSEPTITTLPTNLFNACPALETFDIPDSVTTLPANLFAECTALKTVTLPEAITTLPANLFAGCTALESLEIPATVTKIEGAFISGCYNVNVTLAEGNTSYIIQDHALYTADGSTYIAYLPTHPDTVYTIPENTTFGTYAFTACPSDRTVIVPESYTSFAGYVFAGATMDTLDVRANVTSIPSNFGRNGLFKHLIIPTTVTSIPEFAFHSASELITINGNNDISFITDYIGKCAFQQCGKLGEEICINAKTLAAEAFKQCAGIKKYTFGENVRNINDKQFFRYNKSIESMVFLGKTAPTVSSNVFGDTNEFTIYYPQGATGYDAAGYAARTCIPFGGYISAMTDDGTDTSVTYSAVDVFDNAPVVVVIALYADGETEEMLASKVVSMDETSATFTGVTGATKSRIFMWDSLASATPLYESFEY